MIGATDGNPSQWLHLAEHLARRAGEIALSRIDSAEISRKHDRSLVTTTDREIQIMITGALHESFPDHAVCGEETEPASRPCVAPTGTRYCWVIDPLDGTRNYVARLPCFATSIALLDGGVPVVGIIREHNTQQMFSAIRGQGATRNGRCIHVSNDGPGGDHLLGVPTSKDELALRAAELWHGMRGFVCRNLGSTAFELGLVAAGAMSGMLGCRVKIWDIAAGALIIEEAGGVVTDPNGRTIVPFRMDADPQVDIPTLAASRAMHATLLNSIARC